MSATKLTDEYLMLIRRFPLAPIRNRRQLHVAIDLMKELTAPSRLASLTSHESDYLDVLLDLISNYETAQWKNLADPMTPPEALQYLLDESGTSQSELARQSGARQSHISEFLSGNRDLSKESIVRIARFFKVSPELFLPSIAL